MVWVSVGVGAVLDIESHQVKERILVGYSGEGILQIFFISRIGAGSLAFYPPPGPWWSAFTDYSRGVASLIHLL